MIIEIKDAPKIKHIVLDISFDENGETSTQVIQTSDSEDSSTSSTSNIKTGLNSEVLEDFDSSESTEIIEKPVIEEVNRDANVASDMMEAEF